MINLDEMKKAIDEINGDRRDPVAMVQMPQWQIDELAVMCKPKRREEEPLPDVLLPALFAPRNIPQGMFAGMLFNSVPIIVNNYLATYRIVRQSEVEKFNPFKPCQEILAEADAKAFEIVRRESPNFFTRRT